VNVARIVRWFGWLLVKSIVVPGLAAALVLGTVAGPHARVAVSPSIHAISQALSENQTLPDKTRVALGNPKNPAFINYNHGRFSFAMPKGESVGTTMLRGFGVMLDFAEHQGIRVAELPPAQDATHTQ
jgi:hypothetical protein